MLEELNRVDYSPTYYFRVQQAMRLLEIYRRSPSEYEQLASGFQNRLGQTVLLAAEPELVLMPDIASTFGIRAAATPLSGERATIGSALFIAHLLKQLQGDRFRGFDIARIRDDGMGWAFDVSAGGLSKTDARDLKFILTDLRRAGLVAWSEDDRTLELHIVRHPAHAATFERFYWDTMAGN